MRGWNPCVTTCFEDDGYRKTALTNGIRVVTESLPHVASISMGIWIRAGSRYEDAGRNGISHFIEHMLFKGTERRSAYSIAREIDSVGGVLNAFTSKEMTAIYCKVTDDNLDLAADLLSDIFLNASFPEDEIEREKQVVCQEMLQLEDCPEDLIHETLGMRFWLDNPLGWPIMGTIPTVVGLDRDTVTSFKREAYSPVATFVAAAGRVEHQRFVELIERHIGGMSPAAPVQGPVPPGVGGSTYVMPRELEQVHVCIGVPGPTAVDERRHAAYLINTILGGGMSSRLFQEIREKRGLAYSVYSFISSFSDAGMVGVYAACEPPRFEELLSVLRDEMDHLTCSLTEEDLRTAKSQLKGHVMLSLESSDARMNRLAKGEFYFDRYLTVEEVIHGFERVSVEELRAEAAALFDAPPFTVVALGPVSDDTDLAAFQA